MIFIMFIMHYEGKYQSILKFYQIIYNEHPQLQWGRHEALLSHRIAYRSRKNNSRSPTNPYDYYLTTDFNI